MALCTGTHSELCTMYPQLTILSDKLLTRFALYARTKLYVPQVTHIKNN